MKLTKKTIIQMSIVTLLLMVFSLPLTAFAKPAKVDVCHWDADQGAFKLLNISEKALKAHLKQGGVLPGTNGLDENCNPLPDNDGDGVPDVDDADDDNDGIDDVNDPFPFDPTQPRSLGCQAANQVSSRTMSPGERWVSVSDNFYGGEMPTFHINSPIQSGGFSLYLYIDYGNTDITGLDYVTQSGSYTIPVYGSGTQHVQLEMRYLGILGGPVEVGVSCQ